MFKSSKFNMVLALIIAIMLWSYVVTVVDPSQTRVVKGVLVTCENSDLLKEKKLAIVHPEQLTIDIKVEGSRDSIAGIKKEDFRAVCDVSECKSGDNIVEAEVSTDKDVKRAAGSTVKMHIKVEDIITSEKNIEFQSRIKKKNTETVYEIVSGDKVSVTGPVSILETIDHVTATVKSDAGYELAYASLRAEDVNGEEVKGVMLSMDTVELKVTRYITKMVKLKVDTEGSPQEGYEIRDIQAPSKVRIKGEKSIIEGIDFIEAEAIDISGFNKSNTQNLSIEIPEGVSILTDGAALNATIVIAEEKK